MHMNCTRIGSVLAVFVLARTGLAAPLPATSLNTCQNAVKAATKAFVTNKVTALGTCLQAVSTQIVKKNAPDASAAAGTCVSQFRRLNDSRGTGKSLPEKLTAAIGAKCTPGGTNTHALADIIGSGAGVAQPLDAENLNAWCAHYGGDGSIDSLQEWIDCIEAAAECNVASSIASQYPRAIDWLNLVKPSMQVVSPPAADPTKVTDAVAGLDAVKAELDGPNNDNVVSIQCGGIVSTGTSTLPKSGQTTAYGAGSDGSVQAGSGLSYTDNGDGTITDNVTGLMWEKKDDSGGIHDKDNGYTWSGASYGDTNFMDGTMATTFLATLNAGGGFAGHTDWRIPNAKELQSIVNYEIPYPGPTVDPAFHHPATCTGCTDVTVVSCSCTESVAYWSSSTDRGSPGYAWYVYFSYGFADSDSKDGGYKVRAVRGGL